MLRNGIYLLFSLSLSANLYAYSTYTKEQLNDMYRAGSMPSQASPVSKSAKLSFGSCIRKSKEIISSVSSNYPVQTLVDTSIMYSVKVWTNDAAMIVSCSQPDQKIVITTSKYL